MKKNAIIESIDEKLAETEPGSELYGRLLQQRDEAIKQEQNKFQRWLPKPDVVAQIFGGIAQVAVITLVSLGVTRLEPNAFKFVNRP